MRRKRRRTSAWSERGGPFRRRRRRGGLRLPDRRSGLEIPGVGSVHLRTKLLHFLLDMQLLDLEPHESFTIGSGSLVLIEDTHLEGGMPLLQGIETGIQAHGR